MEIYSDEYLIYNYNSVKAYIKLFFEMIISMMFKNKNIKKGALTCRARRCPSASARRSGAAASPSYTNTKLQYSTLR